MNEYTTDVRDLDNLYLATIAGADYYEVRQIVRQADGVRSVVGRASDWPIIEARATSAELAALLTASERRSVEADCHVVELLARQAAYQAHIAALEAALAELTSEPPRIAPPEAEAAAPIESASVAAPTIVPIALSLGEPPWRCAHCQKDTHAQSAAHPSLCIRCVVNATDAVLTNGHQAVA